MPETEKIVFTYKEIAESLVTRAGVHEGIWGVYVEFGITGANIGRSPNELLPAAIVPIVKVGISRCKEPTALTVDAAEVNPEVSKAKK